MSYQPKRMQGEDPYKKMRREYEKESKSTSRNKSKGGKASVVFKTLALIYVIITIVFYVSILKLNMLPNNILAIVTVAIVIFTLLIGIGLAKNHKTKKLNVFCLIIAIIVSCIYIYATNYINATTNFLGTMFQEVQETEDYYVVVRNESSYNELADISGDTVYTFQPEQDVMDNIEKEVNVSFENGSSLTDIGNNLISEDIDVILTSSSQYNMLVDEIENFKEDTKIIFTTTHKIEKKAEVKTKNSKYTIDSGIFNVYISGIDTSGSISNVARSDANILATVNTKTHEVLLTSIPRDYYVTLHSKGAKDKLTHSGIYGIDETVTTVEDLLDIDINYYVRVNFTTVIKLVDTLGGIEVYSDYDFTTQGYHFNKGYNTLNGEEALAFSRERYSFASGDNQRVKNQQAVIEAIFKKVMNSETLLTRYTSILESLEGCFQTNVEQSEISDLVKDQLNNMSSWTIKTNALTGSGSYGSTYSMGSTQLYIMLPDESSVENAKAKINSVLDE